MRWPFPAYWIFTTLAIHSIQTTFTMWHLSQTIIFEKVVLQIARYPLFTYHHAILSRKILKRTAKDSQYPQHFLSNSLLRLLQKSVYWCICPKRRMWSCIFFSVPLASIPLSPNISVLSAELGHPSSYNILMVPDSFLALKTITTTPLTKTYNSLCRRIHNLLQHILNTLTHI